MIDHIRVLVLKVQIFYKLDDYLEWQDNNEGTQPRSACEGPGCFWGAKKVLTAEYKVTSVNLERCSGYAASMIQLA